MISDIFLVTGMGLVEPILAIFIKENLIGGTILAAGIASTIFLLTKCAVQLPFSRYVDRHDDKVKWLIVGTFLFACGPFIYMFADHVYMIYFAQFLQGIGSGLAFPTWLGLWSTHLDKHHESFEWTLYSTFTSLGTALTALVGAAIASYLGFRYAFLLFGLMAVVGSLVLFGLEKKNNGKIKNGHYHRQRNISKKHH